MRTKVLKLPFGNWLHIYEDENSKMLQLTTSVAFRRKAETKHAGRSNEDCLGEGT
jgi:hypothetical protein